MTATEFRAALTALFMNQTRFAQFVGVDPRTVRRWAAEGPPNEIVVLLRLATEVARLGGVMGMHRVAQG
jgi:DNA-binding transcriptional regulator YiaG